MSSSDEIGYEEKGRVAYITIDRPTRRNALSTATNRALLLRLAEASSAPSVSVIVLTGAGDRAFCAGADLKELDALAGAGSPVQMPMTGVDRNLCEALLETYKPVIAELNGPAVAAGCELALACDLRIAAPHAYLALPEAKRGLGANFATVMLPRLVPSAIAFEMLYTGEPLSAEDALRWGLYNRVVPSERLREVTESLAEQIAMNAPLTLRRQKEMVVKSGGLPHAAASRLNVGPNPYQSADREEGTRAYLEKRAPRWQGR